MQRNYIGPNLMNQVNVSPAPLTSLARDLPSLPAGQTEAFTLSTSQSHSCRVGKKKKKKISNMHLLLQPIKNVLICNELLSVCFKWLWLTISPNESVNQPVKAKIKHL